MSNVSGAGGSKIIAVAAGDNLTVDSFSGFGIGATAAQPLELDTLKFTGTGMTAANLSLTQSGTDVVVDGGGGNDTLHLDYAGAIDFGNLDGNAATSDRGKITGIETISVDNGQNNALTLHLADVLDMNPNNQDVGGKASLDNVLKFDGNAGDTLHLAAPDGWSVADTATLAGYAVYASHDVRVAVETAIAVTVN